MSTALEAAGRPISSCAGGDRGNVINSNTANKSSENNCVSATSTVVLDPAAFLENWKKQIQGKHSIPVHQQRLTFSSNHYPYPGINLFSWSCATQEQSENGPASRDFVTCLQSWQAILRSEKCNIAKLLNPEIFTESDKLPSDLKSKTAEEIRDLGIPCSVYYLSFSKCILAAQSKNCQEAAEHCKDVTNLCIKVDQEFQLKEFEVDLYGRLSKSSHPLHFSYRFNGRYLVAHLSMLEQTVQYRQGQKMRHSLGKRNSSVDKVEDGSLTEPLLDTNGTSVLVKPVSGRDYYIPGSKDQEITTIISRNSNPPNSNLRCIILTVITLNGPWERTLHALVHQVNGFNERKTPAPDSSPRMQKHIRKEAGRTQQWNSKCLLNSTAINHVSDPKSSDSAKQKGVVGAKPRKYKGSCPIECQPSKSAEDESLSNLQTDSSNECSSSRPSDSSKADDTSKTAMKKKKRKKAKRNTKNNVTDTPVALKESSQECNLASAKNVTSTSGNGHIPFSGSSKRSCNNCDYISTCETNICKTNIETADNLEMCTTQMGETIGSYFSSSKDLSNQRYFHPQETCASGTLKSGNYDHGNQNFVEGFLASAQIVTSNLLTDESTHDEKTSAFESSSEGNGSVGLQCNTSSMDSEMSVCVLKSRLSDFHRFRNGICSNVIISNSNFQGGSSDGNLQSGSGLHNNDTGNRNEMMAADSHVNNKHIAQVGRARETQIADRKVRVAGSKKPSGTNCGLSSSSSGNTNSFGIGNVHNKSGKENNHAVWQKVQKLTVDDNIHESGSSDFMQSHSVLDSQNVLPEVDTNSEKNAPIQIIPTSSQKYRDNESKHSQQKFKCSNIYLEQCDTQNRRVSSDVQSRFRVQEDLLRSQHGRDDKSLYNTDRLTMHSTHTTDTNISKAFEQKKTGRSHSDRPVQYVMKGYKNFSIQNKHSKSFPPHRNAEMHDADQADECKSSFASSASHQFQDTIQTWREDLSLSMPGSHVHVGVNKMLPLSRISNSVDQELLPTNDHLNEARKTTDTSMLVCGKKDTEQHTTSQEVPLPDTEQHTISQEVPIKIKCSGMVMVSIPETVGVDTQLMDVESNFHEGSSNHALYSLDTRSKSTLLVKETSFRNHVDQTNAMEKEHTCEVSSKCSSSVSTSTSLSNLQLNKMAQAISDSISASYQSQLASESIALVIGSPLAEFEKVLYSVSPVIESVPWSDKCSSHFGKPGITSLVCKCQIADIPLKSIWHWFEKPCNYGLEVKAEDIRLSERFNVDGNLFRAYFVPFLSGIQLFGFSGRQSCSKGAVIVKRQEDTDEIRKVEDSYYSHFENLPILSSLLPKPFVAEETGAPLFSQSTDTASVGNQSCNMLTKYCDYADMEILFEYFESEQPQLRRPLLEKIRELIKSGTGSSCQAFGDQHILESIKFRDLHPASWFSVAWYPIYQIPEGQFRAAFLTYHSLGHFVYRDVSSDTLNGDTNSCIAAPVVGLQNYNAQGECWFVPSEKCENVTNEIVPSNPLDVLRDRMRTLEETASLLARGCAKKDSSFVSSKQSDYEFFLTRNRQSLIR